jgi:uncharacterized protein DUF3455
MCRILRIACATALAVAFAVALPQPARADNVTPPPVPDNIQVEPGNKAFLVGHAVGTQNYICLPCPNPSTTTCPDASGFAYILFTPEATLFKFEDNTKQLITHYFSPNLNPIPPEKKDTIRATWQDSKDTSTVWAKAIASATHSSDPDFVADGAIAWVLLQVVGAQDGPTRGDKLSDTTFIQRLKTSGGLAPKDCTSSEDVGKQAFQPYTADYFFYKEDSN